MPYANPVKRREYHSAYSKGWRVRNKERLRQLQRERRAKNKDKDRENRLRWYAENREKVLSYQREYRSKHADLYRERSREWHKAHRYRSYGLSRNEYTALVEAQAGSCRICSKQKPLVIDHCHTTGKVRGLLCRSCNTLIGLAFDDAHTLERAIEYLQWQKQPE